MQKSITFHALSLGEKILPLFIIVMHFSPPATLVSTLLLLLAWFGSGYPTRTPSMLRQSPVALYALLLFLWLGFSTLYSAAPLTKALATLAKYRELLLPLILIPFLSNESQRRRCETVLLMTLLVTLWVSIAGYLHWLPVKLVNDILKNRITHSLFMAFLGFYSLHQLSRVETRKPWWAVLLILIALNLFVMSNGRTGQVVFLGLGALFVFQQFKLKTSLLLTSGIIVTFAAFLWLSPYAVRFWDGIHESVAFFNHSGELEHTSMGERLHFWTSALHIIENAPWLGEGVGGFPYAFSNAFPNESMLANPHNEFLLMTAQLGLPGLLAFLSFLGIILRQSFVTSTLHSHLLQGVWLMLVVSCLFNSSILDHTEGHWFMTTIALFSASLIDYRAFMIADQRQETQS